MDTAWWVEEDKRSVSKVFVDSSGTPIEVDEQL